MKFSLIRELNADHALLLAKLDEIREHGQVDAEVHRLLTEVRAALVGHLDKEEKEFYPVMRQAAEKNEALRNMLQSMGVEMEAISAKVLKAIDGWLAGEGLSGFAVNFESFRAVLADRIRREEHALYAKYLKLMAS